MKPVLYEETAVIHYKTMRQMGIQIGEPDELRFLALAFAGEAGEVANVVKKMWRDGESAELMKKLKKEMADCIIYMSHMLEAVRTTEDEVVELKLDELKERWPWVWDNTLPQGDMSHR